MTLVWHPSWGPVYKRTHVWEVVHPFGGCYVEPFLGR